MPRSSPWRLAMAAGALALAAAACSSAPTPTRPVPPPPDPEAAVSWATSELDPCALLSPAVAAVEDGGPVYAVSPHSCAIGGTADQRIVVAVGTALGTADRAVAAPVVVGDRRAYLTRDVPIDPKARCAVDFPISPTRSVRVSAPAGEGDLAGSCATATTIAEPIGRDLAAPAERVRAAAPGDVGRWGACDLIGTALGWQADRGAFAQPDADTCRGTPQGPGSEPSVQVRLSTGPAVLPAPGAGERTVQLAGGPALQAGTAAQCTLTAIAQVLSDATAHRITVVVREATDDPCTAAAATMATLTTAVADGRAAAPPAPAALGYAPSAADDPVPAACGIGAAQVASCRAPRRVPPPDSAAALVGGGADPTCAMLGSVAASVGELEMAAADGTGCIGLAGDGYAVTVGVAPGGQPCAGSTVPLAGGRSGIRCPSAAGTFDLAIPLGGPVLRITGQTRAPRGDRARTLPADAAEQRTRALTDALVTRYVP
ncbi:hypothetical protein ACQEVB_17945 [Pseudonocardia sp. CA-107938]|uniref:hypothetical protein n=1 Tax=Pseudonocardia sp. CA-107938 TaxID=3240021 RepID=UPI003D90EDCD